MPGPPQRPAPDSRPARNLYPAYCFALLSLVSVLALFEARLVHWFLLPVVACGLLIGRDAAAWIAGRLDLFDPRGVIGILGVHLFCLAPLLVVFWDFDYDVALRPADWRPWLGIMAALNAAGLVLYFLFGKLVTARGQMSLRPWRWEIDHKRALGVLVPALLLSAMAQVYLWVQFGGVARQIAVYKAIDAGSAGGRYTFQLLAGALPILLLMLMSVLYRRRSRESGSYSPVFVLLGVVFVLYFVIDGLRGSRSATVWTMFCATGIIHYFWRRLNARIIFTGLIPLLIFMYFYGFYKAYGSQVWREYQQSEGVAELSQRTGRSGKHLLIRDLSRSDIQAFMVYRLITSRVRYQPEWGATYVEALPRTVVPKRIWPGRPDVPRKTFAGARLHFGGPNPYGDRFSKVYGLAGEGMLNFHLYGPLLAFVVFGVAMGLYRRYFLSWPSQDARLYLAPFVANAFLIALIGDFDNMLTFVATKMLFPAVILLLIAKRCLPDPTRRTAAVAR